MRARLPRPAAGTINACITILKEWGVKRIKVLSVIASKQGTWRQRGDARHVERHADVCNGTGVNRPRRSPQGAP